MEIIQTTESREILTTNDYNKFSFIKGNRDLNKSNVKKIIDSIRKYGYDYDNPIEVDSDFRIIDGQHRFEALKELGLHIPYVIKDFLGLAYLVIKNSAVKAWTYYDIIKSFATLGYVEYVYVQNCFNSVLNKSVILQVANKNYHLHRDKNIRMGVNGSSVKNGSFVFFNKSVFDWIIENQKQLTQITPFHKQAFFIYAIAFLYRHIEIDWTKFFRDMIYNKDSFEYGFASTALYVKEFEKIYNDSIKGKNKIDFFKPTIDRTATENEGFIKNAGLIIGKD